MENKNNRCCQVCLKKIPDDFINLLCSECYDKQVKEIELKKEEEKEQLKKSPTAPTNNTETVKPVGKKIEQKDFPQKLDMEENRHGILDPNYKTNPQKDDKDQVLANLAQFVYSKKLLWYPTRNMYNAVKLWCMKRIQEHPQYPKYLWKPKIVDVGCGSGVGSNVLSQEADFVWGIDKNEMSINFAREAFTRQKNGIYYSSQLTFDKIDIMQENREIMKFDVVVAIEIIEHIEDTDTFMKQIIKFAASKKGDYNVPQPTTYFISTPNRNNPKIRDDQPQNIYHCMEWTAEEFKLLMERYFQKVELLNQKGEPLVDLNDTPIMAMASIPKI